MSIRVQSGGFRINSGGVSINVIPAALLAVGDSFGGGIIAYILQPGDSGYDPNVQKGLIRQPSATATYAGSYSPGATNALAAFQGTNGFNDWSIANTTDMLRICNYSGLSGAANYWSSTTQPGFPTTKQVINTNCTQTNFSSVTTDINGGIYLVRYF